MTAPPPNHAVVTDIATYVVTDDLVTLLQALIVGRAIDELTSQPPPDAVRVVAALEGVSSTAPGEGTRFNLTTGDGGTFAVSGVAERALPNHAATAYVVDLVISAPGYLETPVSVPIPAASSFPLPPVEVTLRRRAVWLEGRVIDGSGAPVPNTSVSVVAPAGVVGMQAALSFVHSSPTPVVATSVAPLGAPLTLWRDAFQAEAELWLWARTNLAPGSILQLSSGTATEYVVAVALPGPTNLDQPGRVVLRAPISFDHQASTTLVQIVNVVAPLAATTLSTTAYPGDEVLLLTSSAPFSDGQVIQINDANPSLVEWRVLSLPAALSSNPGGFYRLGPVGRSTTLRVHAVPPALPIPPDVIHLVDYGQQDNVLTLRAS